MVLFILQRISAVYNVFYLSNAGRFELACTLLRTLRLRLCFASRFCFLEWNKEALDLTSAALDLDFDLT